MLKLLLLFIVVENVLCGSSNRALFKTFPKTGIQCDGVEPVRTWYINYIKAPCSWKGSEEFTNFVKQSSMDGVKFHWRTAMGCVKNIQLDFIEKGPGNYLISDRIGDVITGYRTLVCSDCKTYAIYWGCTRKNPISGTCIDPWMTVETSERTLSPDTLGFITKKIQEMWHMVMAETVKVKQDKNKCCIPKTTPTVDTIAEPQPEKQGPIVP